MFTFELFLIPRFSQQTAAWSSAARHAKSHIFIEKKLPSVFISVYPGIREKLLFFLNNIFFMQRQYYNKR